MMTKGYIKFALVAAQLGYIVVIVELIANKTAWSMLVIGGLLLSLFGVKCKNCGTPLWKKEIVGTRMPVNPKVVDHCPVCGHPMA